MQTAYKVHKLINRERKKRGLHHLQWDRRLAKLAFRQAKYCSKVHRLVHSKRYAFQGGENLALGGRHFNPKAIVTCWMHSKAGHREYLLSPRATKAGVGVVKSRKKTYVAWAFSDEFTIESLHIPRKIRKLIQGFATFLNR